MCAMFTPGYNPATGHVCLIDYCLEEETPSDKFALCRSSPRGAEEAAVTFHSS